jgi:hypothetical protein
MEQILFIMQTVQQGPLYLRIHISTGGNGTGCHNEIPPTLYYTVYPGENVSGEGFRSNLDYISVALGREGMTILWNIFLPPPLTSAP